MPAADRQERRSPPYGLALAVAVVLAAFAVWTVIVQSGALRGLEERLTDWLWAHQVSPLTSVAEGFAHIGHWWVLVPAAIVTAVLLARRGRLGQGVYIVLSLAAAELLDTVLKELVRRRPPPTDLAHAATYAYPSGHTMAATGLAAALIFVAWPTRWRTPVLIGGVAFAVLMGLSRVYLTVHWPSDVVAGWLLGFGVAAWLRLIMDAAFQPRKAGAERAAGPGRRRGIDAVFFDWGDTLMVDDGSQTGPMATWPKVAAVDGAQETLRRLRPHYRLLVATNADESSGPDVRAALARVGLDAAIDGVVSSRDVGARKPDAAFFAAALRQAGVHRRGVAPARAVMVGDSIANDVAGAKAAGLRAVWFNPSRRPLPPGAPAPDAVVAGLRELPQTLARLADER